MKKIILLTAIMGALLAGGTSCHCHKEEYKDIACGGYGNATKAKAEDLAVWNEAAKKRPELRDLTIVTVSRQVVAGMNYRFACRDKAGNQHEVNIFKPLAGEGEVQVTSIN